MKRTGQTVLLGSTTFSGVSRHTLHEELIEVLVRSQLLLELH